MGGDVNLGTGARPRRDDLAQGEHLGEAALVVNLFAIEENARRRFGRGGCGFSIAQTQFGQRDGEGRALEQHGIFPGQ